MRLIFHTVAIRKAYTPAALPPTTDLLRAVRYQHTQERQPKRQVPLRESGCFVKEQFASSITRAIPVAGG